MIGTKISAQFIILFFISGISTTKQKTQTELKYEEYLNRVRNFPLKDGPNIPTVEDYMEPQYYHHSWFVGVKIFVSEGKHILIKQSGVLQCQWSEIQMLLTPALLCNKYTAQGR